jgi:ATP-dependent Clp protease ATP-binding subunit ClpC
METNEYNEGRFSMSYGSQDEKDGYSEDPRGKKGKTPVLDQHSRDVTDMASKNELDPIIGRDSEIERVSQILSRRKKNNPVLIGEPGVGKSAIAEGLALKIIQRKVPRTLLNKRVLTLDMGSIVAGTKYRGQFEERIKAILEELRNNKDIIIFIDEIHTMVGAGGASGSLDAANMFKPPLARGEIQCIGATTLNEYRQHIEKDGALERRFQKVLVSPPDFQTTVEILNSVKSKYEDHHNVSYTDDAIINCVKLTERYITDRNFPDKALDALDEAGSRTQLNDVKVPEVILTLEKNLLKVKLDKDVAVKKQDYEGAARYRDQERKIKISLEKESKDWEEGLKEKKKMVDGEKVAEVVSMMSGVPLKKVSQGENEKLLVMSEELKGKVIGQDHAIQKVSRSVLRNRMGLKDPNKPIGTFLFLGPTGVGKTQLAKELAKYMFGDTDSLIRIDMSEYSEKFEVTKLTGAPPGYVGHEEGGQLTEKVRRKPYSIVLFDEIEKAHPEIFNTLLQILDEGHVTDSMGRSIDFKNTLIILTSNVGQRKLNEFGNGVGFGTTSKNERKEIENEMMLKKELEKTFSPEFINRLDDIIYFKTLDKSNILEILEVELSKVMPRLESLGFKIKIAQDLKDKICEIGYEPKFGARPLKRVIQKYVEDTVADLMVQNKLPQDCTVTLSFDAERDGGIQPPVKSKIVLSRKKK